MPHGPPQAKPGNHGSLRGEPWGGLHGQRAGVSDCDRAIQERSPAAVPNVARSAPGAVFAGMAPGSRAWADQERTGSFLRLASTLAGSVRQPPAWMFWVKL